MSGPPRKALITPKFVGTELLVTPRSNVDGLTSKARCVEPLQLRVDCLCIAWAPAPPHAQLAQTPPVNADELGEPNHHRSAVQVLVKVFSRARSASFPTVVAGALILGQPAYPMRPMRAMLCRRALEIGVLRRDCLMIRSRIAEPRRWRQILARHKRGNNGR
jgi:hypothetical protein